ncbi:hypothetical protein QUA56_34475 [Microcoleus sp. N3A4]|uniref:hypothetical protein n=1 Tax=Microcoleus sp. N3A4 TaxID=3055379 RepID=UPI002FD23E79
MSTIGGIAAADCGLTVPDLTKTLFIPKILGLTHILHHSRLTGFPACEARKFTLCGTGKMPVPKQVIENGATSQFEDTYLETRLMA